MHKASKQPNKPKVIIVTGTPGAGKSFLAKKLSLLICQKRSCVHYGLQPRESKSVSEHAQKQPRAKARGVFLTGYSYLDVNKLVKERRLYDSYNPVMDTFIVNTNKLSKHLIAIIKSAKKGLIIDSHLSHFLPAKYVNLCIVCKCNLKTLKKRLELRDYSASKIRENLDSEIFDVCFNEAKELHKNVIVADCSTKSSAQSSIKNIKSALNLL